MTSRSYLLNSTFWTTTRGTSPTSLWWTRTSTPRPGAHGRPSSDDLSLLPTVEGPPYPTSGVCLIQLISVQSSTNRVLVASYVHYRLIVSFMCLLLLLRLVISPVF